MCEALAPLTQAPPNPARPRDLHERADPAHAWNASTSRRYVRGDCPRCRHRTVRTPDLRSRLGPCRIVEYFVEDQDRGTLHCNLLDPCP